MDGSTDAVSDGNFEVAATNLKSAPIAAEPSSVVQRSATVQWREARRQLLNAPEVTSSTDSIIRLQFTSMHPKKCMMFRSNMFIGVSVSIASKVCGTVSCAPLCRPIIFSASGLARSGRATAGESAHVDASKSRDCTHSSSCTRGGNPCGNR